MPTRITNQVRRQAQHLIIGILATYGASCSSATVAPMPQLPPAPPGYVFVPHPDGPDLGDLMAIFAEKGAPSPDDIKTCDSEFAKLKTLTSSREEILQGAREFVRTDPVKYHWCFYSKVLNLEQDLMHDLFLDQRQKAVVSAYAFLTPLARAFFIEYNDSRYLRVAVSRYRRLSEYVFYKRLEMSPALTAELSASTNPFGIERPNQKDFQGVLHKYGLAKEVVVKVPEPGKQVATLPSNDKTAKSDAAAVPPADDELPPSTDERKPASTEAKGKTPAPAKAAPEASKDDALLPPDLEQ